MPIRFCAYQYQNRPLPVLEERWQRAEELGFDVLANVDTVVDPDRPRSTMFDAPATLTAMALRSAGTWRDAPHEDDAFERACADVLPSLRGT